MILMQLHLITLKNETFSAKVENPRMRVLFLYFEKNSLKKKFLLYRETTRI